MDNIQNSEKESIHTTSEYEELRKVQKPTSHRKHFSNDDIDLEITKKDPKKNSRISRFYKFFSKSNRNSGLLTQTNSFHETEKKLEDSSLKASQNLNLAKQKNILGPEQSDKFSVFYIMDNSINEEFQPADFMWSNIQSSRLDGKINSIAYTNFMRSDKNFQNIRVGNIDKKYIDTNIDSNLFKTFLDSLFIQAFSQALPATLLIPQTNAPQFIELNEKHFLRNIIKQRYWNEILKGITSAIDKQYVMENIKKELASQIEDQDKPITAFQILDIINNSFKISSQVKPNLKNTLTQQISYAILDQGFKNLATKRDLLKKIDEAIIKIWENPTANTIYLFLNLINIYLKAPLTDLSIWPKSIGIPRITADLFVEYLQENIRYYNFIHWKKLFNDIQLKKIHIDHITIEILKRDYLKYTVIDEPMTKGFYKTYMIESHFGEFLEKKFCPANAVKDFSLNSMIDDAGVIKCVIELQCNLQSLKEFLKNPLKNLNMLIECDDELTRSFLLDAISQEEMNVSILNVDNLLQLIKTVPFWEFLNPYQLYVKKEEINEATILFLPDLHRLSADQLKRSTLYPSISSVISDQQLAADPNQEEKLRELIIDLLMRVQLHIFKPNTSILQRFTKKLTEQIYRNTNIPQDRIVIENYLILLTLHNTEFTKINPPKAKIEAIETSKPAPLVNFLIGDTKYGANVSQISPSASITFKEMYYLFFETIRHGQNTDVNNIEDKNLHLPLFSRKIVKIPSNESANEILTATEANKIRQQNIDVLSSGIQKIMENTATHEIQMSTYN